MSRNSEKDNRAGTDKPYYESPAGIVYSSAFLANDITGTPSFPAKRGGPDAPGSGTLDGRDPRTSDNGVPGNFFHKEG